MVNVIAAVVLLAILGVAVVYVGEDLDVLMELSDRILVLCGGRVSGILDGRTADKNEVGLMMTRLGGSSRPDPETQEGD